MVARSEGLQTKAIHNDQTMTTMPIVSSITAGRRFMLGLLPTLPLVPTLFCTTNAQAQTTPPVFWNDGPAKQSIVDFVKATTDCPNVARFRDKMKRRSLRGNAAFANPEYQLWEVEGYKHTIRLPADSVLQPRVGRLLNRPVGRSPHVRRFYANARYQAGSWTEPRRVVANVEWHPSELLTTRRVHRHP